MAPAPAEPLFLLGLADSGGEKRIEVRGENFHIGRAPECELTIDDRRLSRHHASLRVLGQGRAELRDLGSDAGTFVDGQRITEPLVLTGGEDLRLGDTRLRVLPVNGEAPVEPRSGLR